MTEAEDVPPNAPAPAPPAAEASPVLNAEGRERPRFLLEFPSDPALQQLVRAFEAGDYQAVRKGALALVESTVTDIRIQQATRNLFDRFLKSK